MRVNEFASKVHMREPGFWVANTSSPVSYPEDGNAVCRSVEESSFWFAHRNSCIAEVIKRFPPSGLILDIGGGNGFVSLALEKAGWEVALVEPGIHGAINAKARGLSTVINSTFESAGVEDCSVPAAGLFDVVEHIQDDILFLTGIRRALIPNAKLYITVPAFNSLWSAADVEAGHFRRYSASTLTKTLRRAGFSVEFLTYIFLPLPVAILISRVLPSMLGMRNGLDRENEKAAHQKPPGLAGWCLGKVLSSEVKVLQKGYSVPFGGSILVVAGQGPLLTTTCSQGAP